MSEWKQLYAEIIDREPPTRLTQRIAALTPEPTTASRSRRLTRRAIVALTACSLTAAVLGLLVLAAHSRNSMPPPPPSGSPPAHHTISRNGVAVVAPSGWAEVTPPSDAPVSDPQTLLVVGTAGVRPRSSQCQVAKYHVPAAGAVVVIVGWAPGEGGGAPNQHRAQFFQELQSVHRPAIECFVGRGTAGFIRVNNRQYGVYVMIGDQATRTRVTQALNVARSFAHPKNS